MAGEGWARGPGAASCPPAARCSGDARDAQPQLRRDRSRPRRRGAGTGAWPPEQGQAPRTRQSQEWKREASAGWGEGIALTPTRGVPTCARAPAAGSAKHVPGAAARTAARRLPGRRAAPLARGAAGVAAAGWPARGRGAAQVNARCLPRPGHAAAPTPTHTPTPHPATAAAAAAPLPGGPWQLAPLRRRSSCFCGHCYCLGGSRGLSCWEVAWPPPLGMTLTWGAV